MKIESYILNKTICNHCIRRFFKIFSPWILKKKTADWTKFSNNKRKTKFSCKFEIFCDMTWKRNSSFINKAINFFSLNLKTEAKTRKFSVCISNWQIAIFQRPFFWKSYFYSSKQRQNIKFAKMAQEYKVWQQLKKKYPPQTLFFLKKISKVEKVFKKSNGRISFIDCIVDWFLNLFQTLSFAFRIDWHHF